MLNPLKIISFVILVCVFDQITQMFAREKKNGKIINNSMRRSSERIFETLNCRLAFGPAYLMWRRFCCNANDVANVCINNFNHSCAKVGNITVMLFNQSRYRFN